MKSIIKLSIALAGALSFSGCGLQRQIDNIRNDTVVNTTHIAELELRFQTLTDTVGILFLQQMFLEAEQTKNRKELKVQLNTLSSQLIAEQNARVFELTFLQQDIDAAVFSNVQNVGQLQAQLVTYQMQTQSSIVGLQTQIDKLKLDYDLANTEIQSQLSAVNATTISMQAQANAQQIQITQLQMRTNMIGLIDPCGDGFGYDEVLIKLSTGQVVAYFEDKGKRHLTILTPNTLYQTTDESICTFKVDISGNIFYN